MSRHEFFGFQNEPEHPVHVPRHDIQAFRDETGEVASARERNSDFLGDIFNHGLMEVGGGVITFYFAIRGIGGEVSTFDEVVAGLSLVVGVHGMRTCVREGFRTLGIRPPAPFKALGSALMRRETEPSPQVLFDRPDAE